MTSPSKSRVVFLNFWAADMGGAEYSLLELIEAARGRLEPHLVTSENGTLVDHIRKLGVTCHVIPCGGRMHNIRRGMRSTCLVSYIPDLFSYTIHVFRMTLLLWRLKPSIVHANVPKSHIALLLAHRFGFRGRIVLHFREIFSSHGFPLKLYTLLYPSHTAAAICISDAVRSALPRKIRATSTVIHNGTPRLQQKNRSAVPHTPLRLLYLGRIVPWKRCDLLLLILRRTVRLFGEESVRLSLIGPTTYWNPEYRKDLSAEIANRKVESIVRFSEETHDIDTVYGEHDIFVTASTGEPFGRSVAEAQAYGLPVVALRSGGIPEIVEHGESGYLIEEGDTDAFAESVGRFIRHPKLVTIMGRRGRERMRRYFRKDIQISAALDFIQSEAKRAR
jgi:glycosyltransferase involved in cell wall biosynthesis